MAHFAELDNNNQVLRVVVINNKTIIDSTGQESEAMGQQFCHRLFGGYRWLQTSYNGSMRKNYAGRGYKYDAERDAFISPKPYASWILNEETCRWQAPVPMPTDGKFYHWNETIGSWQSLTQ